MSVWRAGLHQLSGGRLSGVTDPNFDNFSTEKGLVLPLDQFAHSKTHETRLSCSTNVIEVSTQKLGPFVSVHFECRKKTNIST